MAAYYNEHDPFAAAWLRELIKAGLIAPGDVDERSIEDVAPYDLAGYEQCHFFAGIGVWSHALRRAGWPDDRPVWTGSCPCQPFSAAGKGGGFADERHLWPAFHHLIRAVRPVVCFGEQVASKDGLAWLDAVASDLEGEGYAFGAVDTCAAGFGAPHIRQRLYWVADSMPAGRPEGRTMAGNGQASGCCEFGRMADATQQQRYRSGVGGPGRWPEYPDGGAACGLGHASGAGLPLRQRPALEREGWREEGRAVEQPSGSSGGVAYSPDNPILGSQPRATLGVDAQGAGALQAKLGHPRQTNGFWGNADWLFCRDGVWRPTIPSFIALVDGLAVDMVRGSNYSCGKGQDQKEEVANASCTQGNTKKELPILPQENGAETNQRQTGGFTGFHAEEVLRQEVHGKVDGEGEVRTEALQGQVPPTSDAGMRNMWQDYFAACPPQERPAVRQHTVELDDIMRELPQASSLAKLHGDRNTEEALYLLHKRLIQESNVQHTLEQTAQVWASLGEEEKDRFGVGLDVRAWRRLEFFSLEVGSPARVGRLRGYGNAIVAPQAEEFVRAYMEVKGAAK